MSQQWKIIVIGSPSQQLAWYGWMTGAKVNPFHTPTAKPRLSMNTTEHQSLVSHKSLLHPRLLSHFGCTTYILRPEGCGKWDKQTGRQWWASLNYTHVLFPCLGNPLAVCTSLHANDSMRLKDSNSRDPSAMELPNARGGIFSSPQTVPSPRCWPLLNWVRPCKCGGYKAETPSPSLRSVARSWERYFTPRTRASARPSNAVRLPIHSNARHVRGVSINNFSLFSSTYCISCNHL